MIRKRLGIAAAALLVCLARGPQCQTLQAVYTSTRSVTSITVTPDGAVVAGTRGGVLVRSSGGEWRKYTILEGLPDNEVLDVYQQDGRIIARCLKRCAQMGDGCWVTDPSAKPRERLVDGQIGAARWNGTDCAATPEGLRIRDGGSWKTVPMPLSSGTHISALLDKGSALWAAVWGDGVWAWDGRQWSPAKLALPDRAREITAMAAGGDHLWFGTTRDGIWEFDGHKWTQHLQADEPSDHNCQALASYRDELYMSTLDAGLVVRGSSVWRRVGAPEVSAETPRQMVEFGGCLYLRQSTGVVDRFDGKTWTKNVFADLPRKQCSALAVEGDRLYVGQWGGWSEFDGKSWAHHLNIADLQGCQVTALLPDGGTLWVGTQRLGIAQVDRATGSVKWHNELAGLSDDTIKCLTRCADTVYAGTFSQGLAFLTGGAGRWSKLSEIATAQVTDLEPDGSGGLYVAARTGLWYLTAGKQMTPIIQGVEVQALRLVGSELWIGTRTGLLRMTAHSR